MHTQGETVGLALVASVSSTSAAAINILDANFNNRPLAATERLIIDTLEGNVSANSADIGTSSTISSSTLIASFNTAVGLDMNHKEGLALPLGVTPVVVGTGASASVKIAGTGRVVIGSDTQGREPWREKLTPGGNF